MCFVATFVSCTKTEYVTITPEEETPDTSSYTIMLYGCGGGNLDPSMILNIQEALLAGATDRVNFVGQIKFSKAYQDNETYAGTQRFIVGDAGEEWYQPVEVMGADVALYDPQVLADFIKWGKEQRPADNYILILWNHGGGWLPRHDYYAQQDSRAVVFDDCLNDRGLSLNNLVKGVKTSDTKFKMIYFDACLMGMVEIVAGLGDCTDYTMCASHITPGNGGDYSALMYHLNQSTNFETAIKDYCRETVAHWIVSPIPLDLTVVNNSKMEPVLDEMKVLSDYMLEVTELCNDYFDPAKEDEEVDMSIEYLSSAYEEAITQCYHYDDDVLEDGSAKFPFFDVLNFVQILASGYSHPYAAKFVKAASDLNRALDNAIVCQQLSPVLTGLDLALAVTIVDQTVWEKYGYQEAYDELYFQQRTGWGNWLKINQITPSGNPNPGTILSGNNNE